MHRPWSYRALGGATVVALAALVVTIVLTVPPGSPAAASDRPASTPEATPTPEPPVLPRVPLRTQLQTGECGSSGTLVPSSVISFRPRWDCTYLHAVRTSLRGDGTRGLEAWNPATRLDRWPEITVNSRYRVTGINVTRDHGLTGTLSPFLSRLDYLTSITIANNNITGTIPAHIGHLSGLTRLDLSGNALTGGIPDALRANTNLTYLDLSDNNLEGEVPAWVFEIDTYDVSGNDSLVLAGSDTLALTTISDGATDALILEWSGAPAGATTWQYRSASYSEELRRQGPWSEWRDMPAATSSYRVTGLVPGTGYYFEVRAQAKGVNTYPSNTSVAITQIEGEATIGRYMVVEGDGETEWRIHDVGWVVTLPDGMRVRGGRAAALDGDASPGIAISDMETGSTLLFNVYTGEELARRIEQPGAGPGGVSDGDGDDEPSVGDLFDDIVESVRVSW